MYRHRRFLTLAVSLWVAWTQAAKADQQGGGQQSGGQQTGGQQAGSQQGGHQQGGQYVGPQQVQHQPTQQTQWQHQPTQQTQWQHQPTQQTQWQQQPTQQTQWQHQPTQQTQWQHEPTQHVSFWDSQPPSHVPGGPQQTPTHFLPHWYSVPGGSPSSMMFPVQHHHPVQPVYRDETEGYVIQISPTTSEVPAVFSNSDPNAEQRARRLEQLLRTKYKGLVGNIKVETGSHGGQSLTQGLPPLQSRPLNTWRGQSRHGKLGGLVSCPQTVHV